MKRCFRECRDAMSREREEEVLREMRGCGWVRPLDVGGHSRSYHSATLARLYRLGVVERRRRNASGYARPSYLYRLTPDPRR